MSTSAPFRFAHVLYRTRRFDAMIRWYQDVFGASVMHQNPAMAFLTYDDEHHRFALLNLDAVMPGTSRDELRNLVGVDHLAYTLHNLDQLFTQYQRFKAQGIEPYWCIHHGVTVSMYYADPDGNQIEFQVDCFATSEETNAYLESEGFAVNPVGVEFDPEDWLATCRSGARLDDFLPRQVHLPVSPVRGAAASPA